MTSWHDEDVNVEPLIGSLTIERVPPTHGIIVPISRDSRVKQTLMPAGSPGKQVSDARLGGCSILNATSA